MKAKEIHDFLRERGTWVNWNSTSDRFLHGDPETDVKGIAVSWKTTMGQLKRAEELGCNLFVTHEPLYAATPNQFGVYMAGGRLVEEEDAWVQKGKWLDERGMVVLRCHDVWDDYPGIGIHGAWARWLGFEGEPARTMKFYEMHEMEPVPFKDFAMNVLSKVKKLGQRAILTIGDPDTIVSRVALGTGAITDYQVMRYGLDADVLVLTDDGTRLWESAQWAEDNGIPLVVVNHATAEEPGMMTLASFLQENFPGVKVHHVPTGCLYDVLA